MKGSYQVVCLLFLSLILNACNSGTKTETSTDNRIKEKFPQAIDLRISKSTLQDTSFRYIDAPFSLALAKNSEGDRNKYILMHAKGHSNDQMAAIPIANIRLDIGYKKRSLILANALDNDELFLDCKNYEQFAVRYASVKQIITIWLNNFAGLGGSKVTQWAPYKQVPQ